MEMDLQEVLDNAKKTIDSEKTHRDYKRVNWLADKYYKLATGDLAGELIRYKWRESLAEFELRESLTRSITPAVWKSITIPFYKVSRTDAVTEIMTYGKDKDSDEKKVNELKGFMARFYGDLSLDGFQRSKFMKLSMLDPNAFIVTEFDEFDHTKEKASPYPFIVGSKEAVYFEYKNNVLQYLIVLEKITIIHKDREEIVNKYSVYEKDWTIIFTETKEDFYNFREQDELFIERYEAKEKGKKYNVTFYNHKAGEVPAKRVGYETDTETDDRTMVSPLHTAVPYFDKLIKTVSELDLTMTKHAFPQKMAYVAQCKGPSVKESCINGYDVNGTICKSCKGSGALIHSGADDVVTFPLPKLRDGETMLPLKDMLHYHYPPIDLIKFQKDYADDLERKAMRAIFNTEMFEQPTVTTTATEKLQDKENANDTLDPFADNYSSVRVKLIRLIAVYTDLSEGLQLTYEFTGDYKLETKADLINELTVLNNSDAPDFLIQANNNKLAARIYKDDPQELKKHKIKNKFLPFSGKSKEEIFLIMGSPDLSRRSDRILYINFDIVMDEIELDNENFFEMDYRKQLEMVNKKIDALILLIDSEKPKMEPVKMLPLGDESEEEDDIELTA